MECADGLNYPYISWPNQNQYSKPTRRSKWITYLIYEHTIYQKVKCKQDHPPGLPAFPIP